MGSGSAGSWPRRAAPPLLRDTVRAGRPQQVAPRWRGALPVVLQCAGAAGVAWWVAASLLGHGQPVFAASSAVVCLAAGVGSRARQAVDLLAGVFVGVLVGQLVTALHLGAGPWETVLAVLAALAVVALFDVRPLALIQAGGSALFLLTLPPAQTPFVRLTDAAVGGALGLLGSQVLFTPDPVRLVVGPARAVLAEVAAALQAAASMRPDDAGQRARVAAGALGELQSARTTARAVAVRTLRGRRRAGDLAALDGRLDDVAVLVAGVLLSTSGRGAASGVPPAALAEQAGAVARDWPARVDAHVPPPPEDSPLGAAAAALARLAGGTTH